MTKLKTLFAAPLFGFCLLALPAHAQTDEAIAERLRPVGTVCIKGEDCLQPAAKPTAVEPVKAVEAPEATEATTEAAAEQPAAVAARSGEAVYGSSCFVCHATGVSGAPLKGDKDDWQARYDAEGGIDGMLRISKAGKGAMPPMGTCGTCSDEELVNAIEFMSEL